MALLLSWRPQLPPLTRLIVAADFVESEAAFGEHGGHGLRQYLLEAPSGRARAAAPLPSGSAGGSRGGDHRFDVGGERLAGLEDDHRSGLDRGLGLPDGRNRPRCVEDRSDGVSSGFEGGKAEAPAWVLAMADDLPIEIADEWGGEEDRESEERFGSEQSAHEDGDTDAIDGSESFGWYTERCPAAAAQTARPPLEVGPHGSASSGSCDLEVARTGMQGTTRDAGREATAFCPLCGINLPTDNGRLNEHIDACLSSGTVPLTASPRDQLSPHRPASHRRVAGGRGSSSQAAARSGRKRKAMGREPSSGQRGGSQRTLTHTWSAA